MKGLEGNEQKISPEKRELMALEKEGRFVFHGTGADVEILEPRQAIDSNRGPDGNPAVFASDRAEYAIFMAIVNEYNCPQGSRARAGAITGDTVTTLDFGMTKETSDQLQDTARGWVYVFDKNQFVPHPSKKEIEFVSYIEAVPLKKIRVSKRDLPSNIEIF